MVLLEAERAAQNRPSVAGEGLVVESEVRDRPVQVLSRQGLPHVASIIGYPPAVGKISLSPYDRGLIGKELQCLLREAG